jgi:dTDP-4-dehydrorhamnose reductase
LKKRSARVLVLGAQGMLGRAVFDWFARRGWNVAGTQFTDPESPRYLDAAADAACWQPIFAGASCDYAINCIGVLKNAMRDDDAASMSTAIRVNALFPHSLARVAASEGARVIHISTDAVFAEGRSDPYSENDAPDCRDHYGRSKALGECPAANVLNIRCSIVGRDPAKGKGLLEWLLRQPDECEVPGFRDQLWNGVTTLQFAQLCEAIIEQPGAFESARRLSSVHHFCPNPATSKYDLLCTWRRVTGKRITICPTDSKSPGGRLLSTIYGFPPALYSAPPGWDVVLSELLVTALQHD